MKITGFLYRLAMIRSRKHFISRYGEEFWNGFKIRSDKWLEKILPRVPGIGDSIFAFNYDLCPVYIAWYKSLMDSGLDSDTACLEIWGISERAMQMLPGWLKPLTVKLYIGRARKNAARHESKALAGKLHPYDWKIAYREVSANTFEIDILECAMLKLSRDFDAAGMFPMICRLDHMSSYYMGNGFERTKTLADGDDLCNCRYHMTGYCQWPLEDAFGDRR